MSCCSRGYCNFKFPEGPPIVDDPVTSLEAKYQFLPYGTLLQQGEVVRIWMESGKTKRVVIDQKISVQVLPNELRLIASDEVVPWQLVALDSGIEYQELINWSSHPLNNPNETPVLLIYGHLVEKKPTLKERWMSFLYKMRTLGN